MGVAYCLNEEEASEMKEASMRPAVPKAEIWLKPGYRRIPKMYFLVDPITREELSSGYHEITTDKEGNFVGHYHGVRYHREVLDPYTGEPFQRFYHEEFEQDGLRIGQISACKFILDPETGKRMSSGYNEIWYRDGFLFGSLGSLEYVINSETYRQASKGYHHICFKNGQLIGELSLNKEVIELRK
jgi:hypothetical protein